MSRYEVLFNDVLLLTRSGRLSWSQIGRKENAEIILNSHLVIRQFSATYQRGDDSLTLLLLERRHLYMEEDILSEREERRRAELLILDEGELAISLTEDLIKLARMMELLDLAILQSNRVRRILGVPA